MIDLPDIKKRLEGHPLARGIDRVPKEHVRIETSFLYPDGASVDLFVVHDEDGPLLPPSKLSDLGQTISWLADVQVKPWLSKKRQRFVDDALRLYGVEQDGGELVLPMASLDELVDGIVLLGQACVRVADLAYTKRSSLQSTFLEQVEEIIVDSGTEYETGAELDGRFGNRVKIDFLTRGRRRSSAILTLASGNASQARIQATEIFRKWYDLDVPTRAEQRISVFDDSVDVYKTEDLERLKQHSDLVALSDRQTLVDLVAA